MTSIPLSDLQSSPSAKFETHGNSHAGRITNIEKRQQTDINNGQPLAWADGTPRWQYLITLEKADGSAITLYAKGGTYKVKTGSGQSMLSAIGDAAQAVGADKIEPGGELAVAYTGDSEQGAGKFAAKLYTAQYRPPAAASAVPVVDLFGSP